MIYSARNTQLKKPNNSLKKIQPFIKPYQIRKTSKIIQKHPVPKTPFFTIIYWSKSAVYLKYIIQSILEQHFQDFQILIAHRESVNLIFHSKIKYIFLQENSKEIVYQTLISKVHSGYIIWLEPNEKFFHRNILTKIKQHLTSQRVVVYPTQNILQFCVFHQYKQFFMLESDRLIKQFIQYYKLKLVQVPYLIKQLTAGELYPALFHKYALGLSTPHKPLVYSIINEEISFNKTIVAHLHCYNIDEFFNIYGEVLETLHRHFKLVVTFSIGTKIPKQLICLLVENRGMDIGSKFCVVDYLQDKEYTHILFLHSKSNPERHSLYFTPFIENLEEIIDEREEYDGVFPDMKWEIDGEISRNKRGEEIYEVNHLYRDQLLDYLEIKDRKKEFIEGNIYFLTRKVSEWIFGDLALYNILNRPTDFDYNYIIKKYGVRGKPAELFQQFGKMEIPPGENFGNIEQSFERIVFNCCERSRIVENTREKACIIYDNIDNIDKLEKYKFLKEYKYYNINSIDNINNLIYDYVNIIYIYNNEPILNENIFNININDNYLDFKIKDILNIDHKFNKDIACITAIYGNYDNLKDLHTNNFINFYCFTNNKNISSKTWKVINYDNFPFRGIEYNDINNNMMKAKYIKICNHKIELLNNYKYIIWIDGSIILKNITKIKWLIYDMSLNNIDISLFQHNRFNNFIQDGLYCTNYSNDYSYLYKRYNTQEIYNQLIKYINLNINSAYQNSDYFELGFFIKNNYSKDIIKLFNKWWIHNIKYSYQDQISFKLLTHKYEGKYKIISDNIYNNIYNTHEVHTNDKNIIPINFNSITNYKNINSYDFWDTLVCRICYDNITLFEIIEYRLKIKNFKDLRHKTEIELSNSLDNNYTIYDIYNKLYPKLNTTIKLEYLINYEYLLELIFSSKITSMINKINNKNNIIVSDYHIPIDLFYNIIFKNNIFIDKNNIYVHSNYKYSGSIWNTLYNKDFKINKHTGDNKYTDYNHIAYNKYNIKTELYTESNINIYENFFIKKGLKLLGFIMRSIRLSNPYENLSDNYILWNLYSNKYLPIMFAKVYALKLLFKNFSKYKFIFMSRDCYLLLHIFKSIFPEIDVDYIYISRNIMNNGNSKYIKYVKNKVKDGIVIDLLGTGNSFINFTKKYNIQYYKYVLLFSSIDNNYNIKYINNNNLIIVYNYFNKYIERLNYASHGSVIQYEDNKIYFKEFEYNSSSIKPYLILVKELCVKLKLINDIIKDYTMDEKLLYEIIFNYWGQNNTYSYLTNKEITVLNKIEHENDHNNIIKNFCDINYFINLYKYLN